MSRLMIGDPAATDAAFAKAKHHVKLRIENNRLAPVSMEPRAAIGDYNMAEDSYTLYTSSQNPHGARTEIAHVFHIAENQLRVVSPARAAGRVPIVEFAGLLTTRPSGIRPRACFGP